MVYILSQSIDLQSILAELRARARDNTDTGSTHTNKEMAQHGPLSDTAPLYYNSDICRDPFTSHRPILGKFIIRLKNFAKELLVQIFSRQIQYNFANAKVATALHQKLTSVAKNQNDILAWRTQLDHTQTDLTARLDQLVWTQTSVSRGLSATQEAFNKSLKDLETRTTLSINESLKDLETRITVSINELKSELRSKSSADEIQFSEKASATAILEVQEQQRHLLRQIQEHTRMAMDQQRRLSILLAEVRQHLTSTANTERLERIASERDHLLDSLYYTLEERFRGTRDDIKDRLKVYLPYIEALSTSSTAMGSLSALDIGCGRGEFLEWYREMGISAKGVELNRICVDECRKMELDVVESEARAFLTHQRDGSFNAVSAIHVVEHLPFDELIALLDEMLRVLRPQGLLILETPNPNNVLVGSGRFYLDPSHCKPLPPALLQFLVEARGFCNVQIHELHPFPSFSHVQDSSVGQRFNELFYGPQDYAVLGYKL